MAHGSTVVHGSCNYEAPPRDCYDSTMGDFEVCTIASEIIKIGSYDARLPHFERAE